MASRRAVQILATRAVAGRAGVRVQSVQSAVKGWAGGGGQRSTTGMRMCAQRISGVQAVRWHSGFPTERKAKVYKFEDVLSILSSPSSTLTLIDVREPHEYAANAIPTALNIPIASQPDALLLSPEDFHDRFGFQKPPPQHEVVFYCKAGVRSSAAAQLAMQAGYENVGEYKGSWLDWERNGGPGTKGPGEGGKGEPGRDRDGE